jgi:hypothetical protein
VEPNILERIEELHKNVDKKMPTRNIWKQLSRA